MIYTVCRNTFPWIIEEIDYRAPRFPGILHSLFITNIISLCGIIFHLLMTLWFHWSLISALSLIKIGHSSVCENSHAATLFGGSNSLIWGCPIKDTSGLYSAMQYWRLKGTTTLSPDSWLPLHTPPLPPLLFLRIHWSQEENVTALLESPALQGSLKNLILLDTNQCSVRAFLH